MAVVKLTKSFIDDAPLVKDGKRVFYHDRSLSANGLYFIHIAFTSLHITYKCTTEWDAKKQDWQLVDMKFLD